MPLKGICIWQRSTSPVSSRHLFAFEEKSRAERRRRIAFAYCIHPGLSLLSFKSVRSTGLRRAMNILRNAFTSSQEIRRRRDRGM